jgi:hypothetical protein
MLFLVMSFVHFFYCAMIERMPSLFFLNVKRRYSLSYGNIWVMKALQSHCLKDTNFFVLFPYAKSTSMDELYMH